MEKLYWVVFGCLLWVARVAQLCFLYWMDAPTGGPIVEDWGRFFPQSMVVEAGMAMAIAFVFGSVSLLLKGHALRKVWGVLSVVVAGVYIVASGGDDELVRWMGQHLSLSFFGTYSNAASDMGLVGRIFIGGIGHFSLSIGWGAATIFAVVMLYRKLYWKWFGSTHKKPAMVALGMLLIVATVGLSARVWLVTSNMCWNRVCPVLWRIAGEIRENFADPVKGEGYEAGIRLLGGDPSKEYPFWKEYPREAVSIAEFKAKPMDERPDIIFLTIETFRGWTGDMRIGTACEKFHNLCRLSKKALYYPNARSVGYPSVEGFLGVLAGVWSHPTKSFLSDYPKTNLRTLPQILSDAGYYTDVLTATEPSFDKLDPWFEAWFNHWEFKSENQHDVPLADRFREVYASRPADKPIFLNWMSTSMHVPFSIPSEYGPTPEDPDEAYVRAVAYMDSAVGIVLDEIEKGPRADQTLIFVVGDHAFGNNAQHTTPEYIGTVQEGYTWVPLMVVGPGIKPSLQTEVVSQVDIAPTILDYLGLEISNNFVGHTLLERIADEPAAVEIPADTVSSADSLAQGDSVEASAKAPAYLFRATSQYAPVFSFRLADIAMQRDSLTYYGNMDDPEASSVFATRLVPDWDTLHLAEGFVTGRRLGAIPADFADTEKAMRDAAEAWLYIVNSNKLRP